MTKAEFERRAAELKDRSMTDRQYRSVPPPANIFAKLSAPKQPQKLSIRDFIRATAARVIKASRTL